ncbi:hypothetical protein D3C87_1662940 [compost metagenome]
MWKQLGQLLVEACVITDDGGHRRTQRLFDIADAQCRQQALPGFGAAQEYDACRATVGAGRAPAHQVVECFERVIAHGLIEPAVLASGLPKKQVKPLFCDCFAHGISPVEVDQLRRWRDAAVRGAVSCAGHLPPRKYSTDMGGPH